MNPLEDLATLKDEVLNPKQLQSAGLSDRMNAILEQQAELKQLKATEIQFSPPLLLRDEASVIFPNTINAIQGQTGAHKSRFAERIVSAILKRQNCDNELLGFERLDLLARYHVLYVDTERNIKEQFPAALQSMQVNAGYTKEADPMNFHFISLLMTDRRERFNTLNEYITHLRTTVDAPLIVVLDVLSDCVQDFNKVDASMEIIDMMGQMINNHDVTFLCILHENPRSDKMRGHLGTELSNKSSTVMQVAFEKDAANDDTNIVKVKFIKCRSTKRHQLFYMKYCEQVHGLVIAEPNEVSELFNSRKHKAANEDIIDHLEMYLGDGCEMKRIDLLDKLCTDFQAKQRTIEARIKEIMETENGTISNAKGEPCNLQKVQRSKEVFYFLKPLENEND